MKLYRDLMSKINRAAVLLSFFLIVTVCFAEEVKKADLAGRWYPGSSKKLSSMLQGYLDDARLENIPPNIIAIIVPHAGYIYSGPVAAYAFKAISGSEIDTVIIVGFSHRRYYDAISVYDRGVFETPLGPLEVDRELARQLMVSNDKFYFNSKDFEGENSVEMQLPFIKYIFKDKDVKIVPIAMGVQSYKNAEILGNSLYEVLKDRKNYLILASTDMSHYHTYGEANAMDGLAIDALKKMDPKALFDKVSFGKCELCGASAVAATMIAAKKLGADGIEILKYANSGDTIGRKENVVGYLSAAIYKVTPSTSLRAGTSQGYKVTDQKKEENVMLTEEQKKKLLKIARDAMETYIKTGNRLEVKEDDPVLNREMGAFVTIHKDGELRGCIGNIIGRGPLYLTVRDMAIQSSTSDPRFPSVTESELKDIDIEISALSELKRIEDPEEIILGKHGVLVRKDLRSGVFLPQVATESGWSKEEFMSALCAHKAGLPPDAWKKGDVEIYVFTAEVFKEE